MADPSAVIRASLTNLLGTFSTARNSLPTTSGPAVVVSIVSRPVDHSA
jgi:hypothetical protein